LGGSLCSRNISRGPKAEAAGREFLGGVDAKVRYFARRIFADTPTLVYHPDG
jgi:hypothetical protein